MTDGMIYDAIARWHFMVASSKADGDCDTKMTTVICRIPSVLSVIHYSINLCIIFGKARPILPNHMKASIVLLFLVLTNLCILIHTFNIISTHTHTHIYKHKYAYIGYCIPVLMAFASQDCT